VAAHEVIAISLVAVPVALLLALLVLERPHQLQRELHSVPLRPAGQLQEGMFRVVGRARRAQPLLAAPVSGRPCLAWRLLVTRAADDNADAPAMALTRRVAIEMRACAEFWIEDDSGRAAVEAGAHFALALEPGRRALRGRWAQLPATARAEIQRRHGSGSVVTAAWDPHPGVAARFVEITLDEDTILSVGGELHREAHPLGEAGPRAAPMRWKFRGTARNPLILTDDVA
jgi:hypothetical protein